MDPASEMRGKQPKAYSGFDLLPLAGISESTRERRNVSSQIGGDVGVYQLRLRVTKSISTSDRTRARPLAASNAHWPDTRMDYVD